MGSKFDSFVVTATQISRSITRLKALEMSELGLRGSHVMCLMALGPRAEGLTNLELCDACVEDRAAISRTVRDLKDRGLVLQTGKEGQRYRRRVVLTPAGRSVYLEMVDRVDRIFAEAGHGIDEADRPVFYRVLGQIRDNLQDMTVGSN